MEKFTGGMTHSQVGQLVREGLRDEGFEDWLVLENSLKVNG